MTFDPLGRFAEHASKPCLDCGEPTEWVVQLQYRRAGDPAESPFPGCPRCTTHGRWKRRNLTTWVPK